MNITINFTSFEIRGKQKEIKEFLKMIHPADIQYFDGYVVVSNIKLYQNLPEVKQAMFYREKQKTIYDFIEREK